MTLFQIACVLLGALSIALAQLDVVATVLHPQVESPLSNRFQRVVWRVLGTLGRVVPNRTRGHELLSWGLPLMTGGLILVWLALLLVGFALLYAPWIDNEAAFTPPESSSLSFADALYFSGVTLTTVGFGDIQPAAWPFRMLAVAEAASGFVVVSLSVAYLLGVYPALSRQRTAAVALNEEVAGQADALPMMRRYLVEDGGWANELAERLRELGRELLVLTDSHETHPVLYYAHPFQVEHSFLRILITAQSLVGALRYGLSPDRHGEIVRNPQLLLLEQSLHYSLSRLSASLHIAALERVEDEGERRQRAAEYEYLCDKLAELGFVSARSVARTPTPVLVAADAEGDPDAGQVARPHTTDGVFTYAGEPDLLDPALDLASDSPLDAYVAFRLETDPHIAAYATACGYALEEASRSSETTWWVGERRPGRR